MSNYRLVLGLEIHFHVKTTRKMFCGCSADIYEADPNTHTCPTCLGLPGALPVPNLEAIKKVQLLGLALNCELNKTSLFDRKHYFYPDLPKGYQISQYKYPLCKEGFLELASGKKIEIDRIHMEEDTAKSFHEGQYTLLDFNKSGMPLGELVTKPVITSTDEAVEFSKKMQELIKLLGVGDADMEKGQLRLEANISLRTPEMEEQRRLPDYKVEIKNINSFKFMENAVTAEMIRQQELLEKGERVVQENRGYDEATKTTVPQREKEEAHDYRYFPEPDIPPMLFSEEYVTELKKQIPELPEQIERRLVRTYSLTSKQATFFAHASNVDLLHKLESFIEANIDPQEAAKNLINRPETRELSANEFSQKLKAQEARITDESVLTPYVQEVIDEYGEVVVDYRNGKENSIEFLVGMVMRKTKGKADAEVSRKLLKSML